MRLVYLWVERYRCFQETGIHFTNKYEIEVGKKESKYYLSKCKKGRKFASRIFLWRICF